MTSITLYLSLIVVVVAIYIAMVPVKYLFPPSWHLQPEDMPKLFLDGVTEYAGPMPSDFLGSPVKIQIGPLGFVAIVSPSKEVPNNVDGANAMISWYLKNSDWMNNMTATYGGLLLRHFNVKSPQDFDNFIGSVHPDIEAGVYLGTTPRVRINGTRYIQSASEAPKIISIPTHIELSFTPNPPKRIYFFAYQINPPPGGHTPLTDFAAVWDQLNATFKHELETRGWIYERWYGNAGSRYIDPLKSKTWQEMFLTKNKTVVKAMAAAQSFLPTWDKHNQLCLRHDAYLSRINSDTNRTFWTTHFNVLHASTYTIPYAWDAQLLHSKLSVIVTYLMHFLVQGRTQLLGYRYGHNVLWKDDESAVNWEQSMHIRQVISRNTWVFAYEQGDLVVLDNHRIAHGRTPWYTGERSVLVAYK